MLKKFIICCVSICSSLMADTTLQETTVTLTSAQIKALNTTPITIVPSQGVGTIVQLANVVFKCIPGTTNFTNSASLNVRTSGGVNFLNTGLSTIPSLNGSTKYIYSTPSISNASLENQSVQIISNIAPTGNPTNDASLEVYAQFYVQTL